VGLLDLIAIVLAEIGDLSLSGSRALSHESAGNKPRRNEGRGSGNVLEALHRAILMFGQRKMTV